MSGAGTEAGRRRGAPSFCARERGCRTALRFLRPSVLYGVSWRGQPPPRAQSLVVVFFCSPMRGVGVFPYILAAPSGRVLSLVFFAMNGTWSYVHVCPLFLRDSLSPSRLRLAPSQKEQLSHDAQCAPKTGALLFRAHHALPRAFTCTRRRPGLPPPPTRRLARPAAPAHPA